MKTLKLTMAAFGALLTTHAVAQGGGEPMYRTAFYSDASHSTEVGYLTPECTARGVQYRLTGTYTNYQEDEFVGTCGPNGPEPL